jgi:hypothetical protein
MAISSPPSDAVAAPVRLRIAGWPVVGYAAAIVLLVCSVGFVVHGGGEAGWRMAVRTSAKTSLVLFLAAFVASSARALWRNDATRWLLANRRYVGVSYAASHAIHLVGIVALARVAPEFELEPTAAIFGGMAYVFLAAMTATSFDRTAAWLGPRRWKRLHKSGMYYNWFIFLISYVPRAIAESIFYAPFAFALVAAVGLRFVAWRRRRRVA